MENTTNSTDDLLLLQILNNQQVRYRLPAIIYTSLLMFIGLPGNVIVLYVYYYKWRKSTSRVFILFLTLLDLVNCLTTLPLEIYIMLYSITLDSPWLCKVTRFSTYVMNGASAAILVAIAVDRFRRICRPHGSQFTACKSTYICIGCVLLAVMISWPTLLIYGTRIIPIGKIQGKSCLLENKFDTSIWPHVFFFTQMIATLIIFIILSVLYYFVGAQVYRHRQKKLDRKRKTAALKDYEKQHKETRKEFQENESVNLIKETGINDSNKEQTKHKALSLGDLCNAVESKTSQESNFKKVSSSVSFHGTLKCVHGIKGIIKRSKSHEDFTLTKQHRSFIKSLHNVNKHYKNVKFKIGRSTLVLFLITVAYVISFLPFYVIAILRQTSQNYVSQLQGSGYILYLLFLRSYLLSSAINPIIYSFCNAQFRTLCIGMFKR